MTDQQLRSLFEKKYTSDTLDVYYRDIFPKNIFKAKHPNYSDGELKYIEDNYRNPVKPLFGKALFEIKKVFNDENYSITTENKAIQDKLRELDIVNWFKNIYCDSTIIDPSSILTFHVKESELETNEDGSIKQGSYIPVYPYVIRSIDILTVDKVNLYFKINGKARYNYVHISTENGLVYRQYNVENLKDAEPTFEIYFESKDVRYWRRGDGIKRIADQELIIDSYFAPATPILDEILFNSITRSIVETRTNFPTPWMYTEDCECDNGSIVELNDEGISCQVKCKKCEGTGKKTRFNVFTTVELPIPRNGLDKEPLAPPGFGYVTPPQDAQRYLSERIKEDIERAFDWLLVNYSNSNVKGSETALGKMIDREEKYSALMLYSQDFFATMDWFLNDVWLSLVFPLTSDTIQVVTYNSFRVTSTAEINSMFSELQSTNAPMNVLRELLRDFYYAKKEEKEFDVVDRYYLYANETMLQARVGAGVLDKIQYNISVNIMKWVYDLNLDQYDKLDAAAFAKIDAELRVKAGQYVNVPISSGIMIDSKTPETPDNVGGGQ